ncbi:MAG: glycoside hydrolase family 95-like protein [Verrucomicrobiota bacterium]
MPKTSDKIHVLVPLPTLRAIRLLALLAMCVGPACGHSAASAAVEVRVDWPGFLARQDLTWERLPAKFDDGAFLGNGLLGATIYQDGDNRMRWEMGRADVTEHRCDNARLPIGGLVLTTVGKIQSGTLRLDLWNAEVRGEVRTDKGTLNFRSLIHTAEMALFTDLETTGEEKAAKFVWEALPAVDRANKQPAAQANPAPQKENRDGIALCTQQRFAGGTFATAWGEMEADKLRRVVLSIADSFPGTTAGDDALATVKNNQAADFPALLDAHRAWWHAFYPKSFVSIPDPKAESFYWIQFYKLASASRPGRVPVDLLGPWYRSTGWPRIWWNLNIEILYLPVYTGNHLELGESFTHFLDKKRANFFRNGKEIWKFDDCATVPHTTDYEGLRGDGTCAPDGYINPGDFTWALHNYYLHYRYSMDESMVTDQSAHAFYPLLRGSINLYLKILKQGADNKLHLPVLHSPEYGNDADNNYNLALLRWGCQTLIELNRRYQLNDPLTATWQETLDKLVAYPVDNHGLRIGATVSFTSSHRHWSHMLMIHPLHIMTDDQPENRELITQSIRHWLTVDKSREVYGWSRASAASLYATLGDGDNAIDQIHRHMADTRFVRPNTQYTEGDPVIECSIVLNRSLQDMLLQSWGDKINVFPAIPKAWDSAVFHDLRAEGAFLVSAERKAGQTRWVRVKSLAGEPCRIKPSIVGEVKAVVAGKPAALKSLGSGLYELALAKGEEAMFYAGDTVLAPIITPVPAADANVWGLKR